MYTSFEVKSFRCFQDFTINSLERVNLITGNNNVGKTALLEALYIHCGSFNPELTITINVIRGMDKIRVDQSKWAETAWESIFNQFDESKSVELIGQNTIGGQRVLRLKVLKDPSDLRNLKKSVSFQIRDSGDAISSDETAKILRLEYQEGSRIENYYMTVDQKGLHTEPIPPSPAFPAFFLSSRAGGFFKETADLFSNLQNIGKEGILFDALRLIEPRLKKILLSISAGTPILHGDIGAARLMPIPYMGEGMVRLANIIMRIANAEKGVVLIDEIENGIHHSIMDRVWKAIGKVARDFNVQIFATTHSWECIESAHRAFAKSGKYDFRLHRLDLANGQIKSVIYDQESLEAAIENNFEVR